MGVVTYLMLVEETNMVEAIPQAYVYYLFRSTIPGQLFIQSLLRTVFLDCSLSATVVNSKESTKASQK